MDKQHFEPLIKGMRGSRTKELTEPDIRAIREAVKFSQTQFAKLIGVNVLYVAKLGAKSDINGQTELY